MIYNYNYLNNVDNIINFKKMILFDYIYQTYNKVFILYIEQRLFISTMISINNILSDKRAKRKKTLIRKAY